MTRRTASTSSPKDHSTQEYNPGCGGYYPAPWCYGRQYEVSRRETLIHRSAWRDCMKSPHRRVKHLSMRRLIAAYTNASRSHIGTSRSLCSSSCAIEESAAEAGATTGSHSLGRKRRRLGSHGDCRSSVVRVPWGRAGEVRCDSIRHRKDRLGKVFSCMLE
jgi:hypothetical protein